MCLTVSLWEGLAQKRRSLLTQIPKSLSKLHWLSVKLSHRLSTTYTSLNLTNSSRRGSKRKSLRNKNFWNQNSEMPKATKSESQPSSASFLLRSEVYFKQITKKTSLHFTCPSPRFRMFWEKWDTWEKLFLPPKRCYLMTFGNCAKRRAKTSAQCRRFWTPWGSSLACMTLLKTRKKETRFTSISNCSPQTDWRSKLR